MKKTVFGSFVALFCLMATGCSSFSKFNASDMVAPGLGIIGSTVGAYATKDESTGTQVAATAGGGLAAWLAGLFIKKSIDDEKQDEFRSGYELGQSNASKSLYWNMQRLHNGDAQAKKQNIVYYAVPASYPNDGAKRVDGGVVLMPVVEDIH